ncbi:galactose oxidase early set domain-containing protein [Coleofasciculus sp. G2-EDA-02]|uniref:galactose oxidase early set domain-containing protein n=1 Tax=Coleofasciculus sp. G2-EDA-02 TaxID=3069529 RepID=UPI0040631B50
MVPVTHSFDNGQRLVDLKFDTKYNDKSALSTATISFTAPAKTDAHFTPPGYYMLFYVNAAGKPSHAKIVQLGTTTATPTPTATAS